MSKEHAIPAMVLDNRGLEPPQPMMRILESLESLPDEATLLAINERAPMFLYPELEARGYRHQTTPHPDGSFHITIHREGPAASSPVTARQAPAPGAGRSTVVVDVRADQRRNKEPFDRIMAAVDSLGPEEDLVVVNTFDPVPLYTVLGRRGFTHTTTQLGPEEWHVRFRHAAAAQ